MSLTEQIINGFIDAIEPKKTPSAYDTPATVTRVEGDTAWVHIPGGVDETPVKLTVSAQAGDTVQVRVGGGAAWLVGNATAPPTDDRQANIATGIAETAKNIAVICESGIKNIVKKVNVLDTAVQEARAIADATNQHFWADDNGAHVSTVEGEAAQGKNLLMNSLGIILRNSNKILAQFSASQVAFYDGEGNNDENIIAVFGINGAVIGKNDDAILTIAPYEMRMSDESGADVFCVNKSGIDDYALVTKTMESAYTAVSSQSSSSPNVNTKYLPLDNYTTGDTMTVEFCVSYTSSGHNYIAKTLQTFTIGTRSIASFSLQGISFKVDYMSPTSPGTATAEKMRVEAYKTTTATRSYRIASVTYNSYVPMPAYNIGTRRISVNAAGAYSAVIGESLFATGDNQTAVGKYNVEDTTDKYVFIAGNGTADNARSNAIAILWDGDTELALDTTASSGTTDGDLYAAITALGWESEVIV